MKRFIFNRDPKKQMLQEILAKLEDIQNYQENKLSTELENLVTAVTNLKTAVTNETTELNKLAANVAALEGGQVQPGVLQNIADTINALTGNVNAAVNAVDPAPVPTPAPTPDPTPAPVEPAPVDATPAV